METNGRPSLGKASLSSSKHLKLGVFCTCLYTHTAYEHKPLLTGPSLQGHGLKVTISQKKSTFTHFISTLILLSGLGNNLRWDTASHSLADLLLISLKGPEEAVKARLSPRTKQKESENETCAPFCQ